MHASHSMYILTVPIYIRCVLTDGISSNIIDLIDEATLCLKGDFNGARQWYYQHIKAVVVHIYVTI